MPPRTRYARNGDIHIAYQTYGDGPIDLLYVPHSISQVEQLWEHPIVARFFERLGDFARVILFDRRESGMSDRLGRATTLEDQMADVLAVLDAAQARGPVGVFAQMEGGPMAMLFAATHPERVGALCLYATFARTTRAEGYEWAPTVDERRRRMAGMRDAWGTGAEFLAAFAPSMRGDESLREWIGKLQRMAVSPGTAQMIAAMNEKLDLRHVLPSIRVPTLVLHRTDDRGMRIEHSEHIAAAIPGARLVRLPGADTFPFIGDTESVLGEVEEFLTGHRRAHGADRVLATVLFSDIVGSTIRAAGLGDAAWTDLVSAHDRRIRAVLGRHRGREIKQLGDGFLATFDGPARAIRAGRAIAQEVAELGLHVRVGLHTGECELLPDGDVRGLAVHIAARVMEQADPGEVLVSSTVRDLVAGSGIAFVPRGRRELPGVPDDWALYAVEDGR